MKPTTDAEAEEAAETLAATAAGADGVVVGDEDEDDDEEYGYESSRSEGRTSYIVQFKGSFGDWCDTGFDTKYENAGQNKFDDYVRRNPNARCRLVEKRNGKVVAVLDTN